MHQCFPTMPSPIHTLEQSQRAAGTSGAAGSLFMFRKSVFCRGHSVDLGEKMSRVWVMPGGAQRLFLALCSGTPFFPLGFGQHQTPGGTRGWALAQCRDHSHPGDRRQGQGFNGPNLTAISWHLKKCQCFKWTAHGQILHYLEHVLWGPERTALLHLQRSWPGFSPPHPTQPPEQSLSVVRPGHGLNNADLSQQSRLLHRKGNTVNRHLLKSLKPEALQETQEEALLISQSASP